MAHARIQDSHCSLCNQSYRLLWGEMMHPADRLCDACITRLWTEVDRRSPDQLEVELSSELGHLVGLSSLSVAGEMVRRARRLRDMVSDKAELDAMLAQRRGPTTAN